MAHSHYIAWPHLYTPWTSSHNSQMVVISWLPGRRKTSRGSFNKGQQHFRPLKIKPGICKRYSIMIYFITTKKKHPATFVTFPTPVSPCLADMSCWKLFSLCYFTYGRQIISYTVKWEALVHRSDPCSGQRKENLQHNQLNRWNLLTKIQLAVISLV